MAAAATAAFPTWMVVLGLAVRLGLFLLLLEPANDGGSGSSNPLADRPELGTSLTSSARVREEAAWPTAEGQHRPPLLVLGLTLLGDSRFAQFAFFCFVDAAVAIVLRGLVRDAQAHDAVGREEEDRLLVAWDGHGRPRLDSRGEMQTVGDEALARRICSPASEPFRTKRNEWVLTDPRGAWHSTSTEREVGDLAPSRLPDSMLALYFFSPASILTCLAQSLAPVTFLLALLAISCALHEHRRIASGFFAACTIYIEGPTYLCALAVPVLLRGGTASRVAFFASFAALQLASFAINGHSWDFIHPTYVWVYSYPDCRPNIGMWWYFLTEVFDIYRAYFLTVLHAFVYVCAVPLTVNMYHRPTLLALIMLAVIHTFQPYPELYHLSCSLVLVMCHPQFAVGIQGFSAMLLVLSFALFLQPVMLYTWLELRSGNANYYYFQSLISNGMLSAILVQWVSGIVARDRVLRRVGRFLQRSEKQQ